jgi:uncharacterized protein (TIGR03382 family)
LLIAAITMTTRREFSRLVAPSAATAHPRLHTLVIGVAIAASGCGLQTEDEEPSYGETMSEVSVGNYTTGTCSTSVVIGLSKQIADEIGCMNPTSLTKFTAGGNITVTSNAVLPYLSAKGKTALMAVNGTVQVNSAFRTVAQQYLLYRWYQAGLCGIPAAATPGRSNHESGRAVDLANYSARISAMSAQGWAHDVAGDPVHFDHLSSPDIRGKDVLAFQRLWNRNNPGSTIAEDGAYGPMTEAKLRAAPATGFPMGASCVGRALGADVVSIIGPDKIAPGAKAHFAVTVENTGTNNWPATTKLIVAGGATSELYDPESWTSNKQIGTIGTAINAGKQGTIEIDVLAPQVTEETPEFTELTLSDGGTMFGTINLAVTVTPNGDDGTSGDADDENDEGAAGGCAAGGGAGAWGAMLIPALVLLRRRRR